MVNTIDNALSKVKEDLPQMINTHVLDYLTHHHDGNWRHRLLDPMTTILLFITQIMQGNTAINHLRHLWHTPFTATAYCKARKRLPLELLKYLCRCVTDKLLCESDQACRWRGHRVWRGDGTSFSMPDEPEFRNYFGNPSGQLPGCGFPVATLLVLCNAAGFIAKVLPMPLKIHEASQLTRLYDQLQRGDVLVYDRAGCSYTQLALISKRFLHAIFRLHQKQIVSFRVGRPHAPMSGKGQVKGKPKSQWMKRLGKRDQLVRWFKPPRKPVWITPEQYDALPETLVLRELRYTVCKKGYRSKSITLVTTLIDAEKYPKHELAEQYLGRWDIELNFRHLKITMNMDVLKCRTVEGVLKELYVFVLLYNLVRLVMLRASENQKVPLARISFVDALRWLCDARDVGGPVNLIVNPHRPGRIEPRAVKRRRKQYDLLNRSRNELRQALIEKYFAA